jgi:MFS family permease
MTGKHALQIAPRGLGFRGALRSRTFVALYIAETASILGDQLARVALSVLVFNQTNSASDTATTYALTFLPAIAGGALLSRISDRLPRRVVLIGCDVVRGALVLAMVIPGLPLGVLLLLLSVVIFINPLFTSAEVALLASVLDTERYRGATALRMMTNQLAQVAGFAAGAAAVALLGPRWGLAIDAISYAVSAAIITTWTRTVPARTAGHDAVSTLDAQPPQPIRTLFANRELLALVGLTGLAGFFIVPEGLAAPYASHLGGGSGWTGTLMTAIPLGSVIGTLAVLRLVSPARRERTTAAMAVLTGVPLIACAASPGLLASAALWLVSGVFAAYLMDSMTRVVQLTPDSQRGQVVGIVGAGLLGVQGVGLLIFGIVAAHLGAHVAVGLAGVVGTACALPMALSLATRRPAKPAGIRA